MRFSYYYCIRVKVVSRRIPVYKISKSFQRHILLLSQVPEYQPIPIGMGPGDTPFSQLAVATSDTVRMSYIMDKLVRKGKFMMLVGTAGTGKTSIVKEFLRRYDGMVQPCHGALCITLLIYRG